MIIFDKMYWGGLIVLVVQFLTCTESGKLDRYQQVDAILLNRWNSYPKLPNLVDLAQSLNLTKLVSFLEKTGLDNTIDHEGPFTLFAPTNEAFNRIPDFAKSVDMKPLLSYHVARKNISQQDMQNELLVRSLLSKRDIRINVYKGKVVTANGCKILKGPFRAFNGLLYVVDDVMWTVYERQGTVLSELERSSPLGVFDHLIQAFELTGFVDLLSSKGPFTLLAPVDEAWTKLPIETLNKILGNDTLFVKVMGHHIVPGTWYTEGLDNGDVLKTLSLDKVLVSVKNDAVKIDNAAVTLPDYTAGNGVIQILDTVLLPKELRV